MVNFNQQSTRIQRSSINNKSKWNDVLAFQDNAGAPKWHWNIFNGGLNFSETDVNDYRLFLQYGGNVGLGTSTPGYKT